MSNTIGYFGFGSLVNRETLRTDYQDAIPTRLLGWKRHWQGRQQIGDHNVALLSIHRAASISILGLLVVDLLENLPKVDEREVGYDRVEVGPKDLEILDTGITPTDLPDRLYVYVGKQPAETPQKAALLQSYTDAVMQGFYTEYGYSGVEHFVETTLGFDRPIITDRRSPRYPRAVTISGSMEKAFDDILQSAGVHFEK